jgi:prepilin signal peptidase PulO-like enzyme (type II secretory pathway)
MTTTALSLALTFAGLLVLLYGLYQARKLRKTLGTGSVKEAWDILSVFIVVFMLGYVGFIATLIMDINLNKDILTASVFFLGAVFVLMTAYYNKEAFNY